MSVPRNLYTFGKQQFALAPRGRNEDQGPVVLRAAQMCSKRDSEALRPRSSKVFKSLTPKSFGLILVVGVSVWWRPVI